MFCWDKLRDYQLEDAKFLASLICGGCFNEQRTGKTPTSLAVAELIDAHKVLILCPASALYAWKEAYTDWRNEPCVVCDGTVKQRTKIIQDWTHGLVISYDTLKQTLRQPGHVTSILNSNPEMLIVDEGHRTRNPRTALSSAVFSLLSIPRRYVLTGTPNLGRNEDLWSLLHIIDPKRWSSYWAFIKAHFLTVRQTNPSGQTYIDIIGLKAPSKKYLQQELAAISTLRKRKDVMPWLPEKDYQVIKLPPTPAQLKYLKELNKYFETEHITTVGILDRLIRYRQICLAPALLELKGSSPKMDWLHNYLSDYPDRPTIIFSKFTSFIHLFCKTHEGVGVIVGATPKKERAEIVQRFQAGELNQIFLNIDAGKESLTLDRAEVMIFTDQYPPIGDIEQAEDRFVSTTQDRADKPHTIYTLVMKGTYDEDIQRLLKARKSETDIINNYKQYLERSK